MSDWLNVTQSLVVAVLCAVLAQTEGIVIDLLSRWPGLPIRQRRRIQWWWRGMCALWLLVTGVLALVALHVIPHVVRF